MSQIFRLLQLWLALYGLIAFMSHSLLLGQGLLIKHMKGGHHRPATKTPLQRHFKDGRIMARHSNGVWMAGWSLPMIEILFHWRPIVARDNILTILRGFRGCWLLFEAVEHASFLCWLLWFLLWRLLWATISYCPPRRIRPRGRLISNIVVSTYSSVSSSAQTPPKT